MTDSPKNRETDTATLDRLVAIDEALVAAANGIKVLAALQWPLATQERFLSQWSKGNAQLPVVTYAPQDIGERMEQLRAVETSAAAIEHPLANYLRDTASSYINAVRMLDAMGRPEFTEHSIALYGKPGDPLSGGEGRTCLDAAGYFVDVADEFYKSHLIDENEYCIPASVVKASLDSRLAETFGNTPIEIVLDKTLAAKAAAGANRIRLRDATCFSEYDTEQLLQHEAYVHSLTARNGRNQTTIRALGLGSPRTTRAQEGLATFAELITGAIDMARLERIALRTIAIDMALGGADFIQVFKFFLESGQPETESYSSTMRVFRGAPVEGGSAFTKDAVYLHGLLEVHTYFRWALRQQRLGLCHRFFAGRMTLGDVLRLSPFFDDGTLDEPQFLPPWVTRTTGLGGYLAFSVFANNIDLDGLDSENAFIALDQES